MLGELYEELPRNGYCHLADNAGQIGLGVVDPGVMALITGSSHVLTGQTDKPIHGKGFFGAYTDGVVKGQYTVEGGVWYLAFFIKR